MEETTYSPFHIPHQTRKHKVRQNNDDILEFPGGGLLLSQPPPAAAAGGLNLSLSSPHSHSHSHSHSQYNNITTTATPVGPFTGYASILSRSRFLRPAQELLQDFSRANGVPLLFGNSKHGDQPDTSRVFMEDSSGIHFFDDDHHQQDHDDLSRRCTNPTLLNMLHEVYKRYKLYCQQMHSAVSSFESVAGLGNAAPFVCFAIKAIFRHFHCLKNAILDHIRVTSKGSGCLDTKKGCASASCSESKARFEQNQVLDANFLQHPVWRSQRGFPDKAVSVLRTWLFEHFLHPYPSDSDKQMLAQKTGLSRSQVSNWFTNARVRLWKPMVEEMHALERKTQCNKAANTSKYVNMPNDPFSMHPHLLTQKDSSIYMHRGHENNCKRSRIDELPRVEQIKEHLGMSCNNQLPTNQMIDVGGSHSSALGNNQDTASGLPWSNNAQIVPFWLAKQ